MKNFSRYLLPALAAILISSPAFAQPYNSLLRYEAGQTAVVFGDQVNLRSASRKDAPVAARLAAGQKVDILAKTPDTLTLNGRTEHWYEVSLPGGTTRGFVWGGLLAWAWADTADLTFALSPRITDQNTLIEARAIRKGQIVHSASISESNSLRSDYDPVLNIDGNRGLENCRFVLRLMLDLPTEVSGFYLTLTLLWNDRELGFLPTLYDGVDCGAYSESAYIFPADPGGAPGRILVRQEEGEIGATEYEYDKTIQVREVAWPADSGKR